MSMKGHIHAGLHSEQPPHSTFPVNVKSQPLWLNLGKSLSSQVDQKEKQRWEHFQNEINSASPDLDIL